MKKPSVPFRPEPMAALQARSAEALRTLYDPDELQQTKGPYPSSMPQHVFDTEDGMRLVLSREKNHFLGTTLHVSLSYSPIGTAAWTSLKTRTLKPTVRFSSIEEANEYVDAKVREITGLAVQSGASTVSPGGVVHVLYKWDDSFLEKQS